ncbi:MAG TPA: cysteine desulfurase family protein [Candidatus Angelobacter sp.]|jgi:cysteine desulfurase|nr:cysteine desulfurase family protein [Candidatus Angelobacter sp.]
MSKIYLDNAASTPIRQEVIQVMNDVLKNYIGNPSSSHQFGRRNKALIERSRISIASSIHALPSEIIFTSGGTEANNLVLRSAIRDLKVKRILSSPIEHKSVLDTILDIARCSKIVIELIKLEEKGSIDREDLERKLKNNSITTIVSLMHANNEIGNISDLEEIGFICKKYGSYFHSDIVQTVGHFPINVKNIPLDFAVASAHKFYGPLGIGFVFIRKGLLVNPFLTGGGQEKNLRAGTENICGIVGMTKALELAYSSLNEEKGKIETLKKYCISELKREIPEIKFNGFSDFLDKSLYTILNISIPIKNNILSFFLDLKGIAVSLGSACASSYVRRSHVIEAVSGKDPSSYLRISFGIFNKMKDIDAFIEALIEIKKNIGKTFWVKI